MQKVLLILTIISLILYIDWLLLPYISLVIILFLLSCGLLKAKNLLCAYMKTDLYQDGYNWAKSEMEDYGVSPMDIISFIKTDTPDSKSFDAGALAFINETLNNEKSQN